MSRADDRTGLGPTAAALEGLSAKTVRAMEGAADEVDAWAHEHAEENSQRFARQL